MEGFSPNRRFAALYHSGFTPLSAFDRRVIAAAASVAKFPARILCFGAGTGRMFIELRRSMGQRVEYYEPSRNMRTELVQQSRAAGLRIKVASTALPNGHFHVLLLATDVLSYIIDKPVDVTMRGLSDLMTHNGILVVDFACKSSNRRSSVKAWTAFHEGVFATAVLTRMGRRRSGANRREVIRIREIPRTSHASFGLTRNDLQTFTLSELARAASAAGLHLYGSFEQIDMLAPTCRTVALFRKQRLPRRLTRGDVFAERTSRHLRAASRRSGSNAFPAAPSA
jgi:hypothetical protein